MQWGKFVSILLSRYPTRAVDLSLKKRIQKLSLQNKARHIFTPQCLNICEIFARSKFVQIHFFPPVGNAVDLITVLL